MRRFIAIVAGILLYCELIAVASAAVSYEKLVAENGVRFLIVSGEFAPTDQLEAFVEAAKAHQATAVAFNSPGGNVSFAMQLGRTIRSMGLDTMQIRSSECASACALAFLGGVYRYAEPGSIGVHQHSFSPDFELDRDDAVAAAQLVTADVLDYLSEMGVDSGFMKLALRYDRNDIRYLSGREMAELKVTTPSDANHSVAAAPKPDKGSDVGRAPLSTAQPAPQVAESEPEEPSQAMVLGFVRSVLEAHSEDEAAAIRDVVKAYSPTVNYFGKVTALSEVIADKRSYFQRWPERRYALRAPTVAVSCTITTCEVTGIMDWEVRSLPRNKQSAGAASFRYLVDVTGTMAIVSEDSQVVRE